jgi:hypothetical protein
MSDRLFRDTAAYRICQKAVDDSFILHGADSSPV